MRILGLASLVLAGATYLSLIGCDKQTNTEYPNARSDLVLVDEYTSGGGAAGYTFGILRLKTKERSDAPLDIGYYAHARTFKPKWVAPEKLMLCMDGARYYLVRQLDLESAYGDRRTVIIDPGCA